MSLDELQIRDPNHEASASAGYRRAECVEAIVSLERAAHARWKGRVAEWRRGVAGALRQLQEALALHVELAEQPEGLLDEILRDEPRLSHRAQQLRDQHTTLQAAAERVVADLDEDTAPLDVEVLRRNVLAIAAAASRHRHASASLVFDAYEVDLGEGD